MYMPRIWKGKTIPTEPKIQITLRKTQNSEN